MRKLSFLLLLGWGLLNNSVAPAQQIVCERLLTTPGLDLGPPIACPAPNGEYIVSAAARPSSSASAAPATHTFVARLQASGCDTVWQRRLPHSVSYYTLSAAKADARNIWLLTLDTVITNSVAPPFKGVRLWKLSATGQVRRITRPAAPTARDFPNGLLLTAAGELYAQVYSQSFRLGAPRAPSLLRFDSTGTLRWRRDYGYAVNYYGGSPYYTPSGNLLLSGMVGVGSNYDAHLKLLEVESSRGDSVRGATLPWGPGLREEGLYKFNSQPFEGAALTNGGYALLSRVNTTQGSRSTFEQLTCVDVNYNVRWRYRLPLYGAGGDFLQFMQVRELADGTLLALVEPFEATRTFWLYRFNAATGALLNVYPFTSPQSTLQLYPAHLLPVASDSSLLVVGGTRVAGTTQVGGIYVARLRVPNLPRVVTGTAPGRAAPASAVAFGLYPNPARGTVTVDLPARAGPGRLELRDALGRLVRARAVGAGAQQLQWELAGVAPGLYAVVMRGAGAPVVRRLALE